MSSCKLISGPPSMIDSCIALPASLYPASAILPLSLPTRNRVRKWKQYCAGLRVPPVDGLPYPPADTACYPSNFIVSKQQRPGERWLDGYRRVLSTAAQGKLFKPTRRVQTGGSGVTERLSPVRDCQCQQQQQQQPLGVCVCLCVYADS